MYKKNPFVFGEVAEGNAFCDRREEQVTLHHDLQDSQKLFLISPRRYGKTSLLKKVLLDLRGKGLITIYIDLYRATSLEKFLEIYCSAVATSCETVVDKIIRFASEVLPRLRPKISIDPNGVPSIEIETTLSRKTISRILEEVIDLPNRVAIQKKKNVVVVMDEFQEILNFEGEDLEKTMRSLIQFHHQVAYVFSGSKKHILEDMFQRTDRAFYKIGKAIYLGKIPQEAFLPFIVERFRETGISISNPMVDHILDLCDNVPYNVQYLCHEIWDGCRDTTPITPEMVDDSFNRLLSEQEPAWISIWDGLPLRQRRALEIIVKQGGKNLYSGSADRHQIAGSTASLQTSLKALVKKGIVEKVEDCHVISDVFFAAWLRQRM